MFDGLATFLKHMQIARSAFVAALVASAILLFGPRYTDIMPKLTGDWLIGAWIVMCASGALCAVWLIVGVGSVCGRVMRAVLAEKPEALTPAHLSADERKLLAVIARERQFYYAISANMTGIDDPLALSVATNDLIHRNLIRYDNYSHSASLTGYGERFVLANRSVFPAHNGNSRSY